MSNLYRGALSSNDYSSELNASQAHPSPLPVRQNLAGGTGVFANFFEEMAEPNDQCLLRDNDHLIELDMSGLANSLEELPYDVPHQSYRPHLDPMHAYYDQCGQCKDDDDLDILDQYKVFVNRSRNETSFDQYQSYRTEQQEWNDDVTQSVLNPGFSEYLPNEFGSDLCISYARRQKPPKVLVKRFLLGQTIGRGSYGKVKDAIDLVTLKRHAVKVISKIGVRKIPSGWSQALLEASVMRRLPAHRHIVSLVNVFRVDNPDRLCLVMEHCLGSVHDLQAAGVPSILDEFDEDEENNEDVLELTGNEEDEVCDGVPISEVQNQSIDAPGLGTPSESVAHIASSKHVSDQCSHQTSRVHRTRKHRYRLNYPIIETELKKEKPVCAQDFVNRKCSNVEASSRRKGSVLYSVQQQQQQQQFRRLSEAQAHAYFLQLVDGLHFLHCHGVIHRDIKPANLLLTPAPGCGLSPLYSVADAMDAADSGWLDGNGGQPGFIGRSLRDLLNASRGWLIKLTDFGVSASLSAYSSNDLVGSGQTTPAVQPPEVAKGVQSVFTGTKLDVYSAGVTLYFMLTGRVPFSCGNVLQIFEAIAHGEFTIPGHVSSNAARLIRRMMAKDPSKRISLKEVSQHPWVLGDPPLPLSLSQIRSKLSTQATNSKVACSTNSRGMMTWLDPLTYLRRPFCEYPLPHIDDTGARIFTIPELDELLCRTGGHDADKSSTMSTEVAEIAPFSVLEKLQLYDTLGARKEEDQDMEQLVSGLPYTLEKLDIDTQLGNHGITPCCPAYELNPMLAENQSFSELKTRHYSGGAEYLRSPGELSCEPSGFRQRGVTISLPAHTHLGPKGSMLQRLPNTNSFEPVAEPPVCPADLPVSSMAYFSPQSALAIGHGGVIEAACLTNYSPDIVTDRPPPCPGPLAKFHLGPKPTNISDESLTQGKHSKSTSGFQLALDDQLATDLPSIGTNIPRSETSFHCDRVQGSIKSSSRRSASRRFSRWFSRSLSSIQRRIYRLREHTRKLPESTVDLGSHARDSLELSVSQTSEHRSLHESIMSDAASDQRSTNCSRRGKQSLFRRRLMRNHEEKLS